jgi:uncharacterized protein
VTEPERSVYVDSSVLLRIVFAEAGQLESWHRIDRAVSSELIGVECLRAVDRARILKRLDDSAVAERRSSVLTTIASLHLVALDAAILARAAEPFPTLLRTLDAVHLATALAVRERMPGLALATHDRELGTAAQAMGFQRAT